MDWDVFISHAWEDKEDIARPLAEALRRKGLRVWYDEFTLTLGDSLRRSIDRGLAQSRYGVVILSPYFFAKEWPQRELDGLAAREVGSGKVMLPVWHNVTWEDVRRFSPTLADKLAVSTAKGLDAVVEEILRALHVDVKPESKEEEHRSRPRSVTKRTPAKPRRPVNWERVGAIAGVIGLLIALGAWLVPSAADFLSVWLSGTSVTAVTATSPRDTPTVTPTSGSTHTPVISTATPTRQATATTKPTSTYTPKPKPTPTFTPTPTPMPMVHVPAGEFIMGSSDANADQAVALCNEDRGGGCDWNWFKDERPQHTVYLDAFYIDQIEVTNTYYQQCVQAGACRAVNTDYNDLPVNWVTWHDANDYCRWAGKRLPTEAEWEKAARGTDGPLFPWGNRLTKGNLANFCDVNCTGDWRYIGADDGYKDMGPVGRYQDGASPYGALDMAGNVLEWVTDWHSFDYYGQSPSRNPKGPVEGTRKVARGGSCGDDRTNLRTATRNAVDPNMGYYNVGFRCVSSSPPPPTLSPTSTSTPTPSPKPTSTPTPAAPQRSVTTEVVFGTEDIVVVDHSTGGRVNITNHPQRDLEPVWSPDGRKVAFVSDRDANKEIYIVNADGSGLGRLTDDPGIDESPIWTLDGKKIIFVSDRYEKPDLFMMNRDGSGLINLTNHPSADTFPRLTSDGQSIVFDSDRGGWGQIYLVSVNGGPAALLSGNVEVFAQFHFPWDRGIVQQ